MAHLGTKLGEVAFEAHRDKYADSIPPQLPGADSWQGSAKLKLNGGVNPSIGGMSTDTTAQLDATGQRTRTGSRGGSSQNLRDTATQHCGSARSDHMGHSLPSALNDSKLSPIASVTDLEPLLVSASACCHCRSSRCCLSEAGINCREVKIQDAQGAAALR